MNRVEIKNKAKEMIRGNKWYIWKPLVIFSLIAGVFGFIFGLLGPSLGTAGTVVMGIIYVALSLFEAAFMIAYAKYILEFVRGNKMEWKEVFTFAKDHFGSFLIISIVVGVNIGIGSALLFIPGIIAMFGLLFYKEVAAENPEMGCMDVMRKAWEITKGHKMDLFVMMLSFIGWEIVAGLTFGILYIWLFPYMIVAFTLAYVELKK